MYDGSVKWQPDFLWICRIVVELNYDTRFSSDCQVGISSSCVLDTKDYTIAFISVECLKDMDISRLCGESKEALNLFQVASFEVVSHIIRAGDGNGMNIDQIDRSSQDLRVLTATHGGPFNSWLENFQRIANSRFEIHCDTSTLPVSLHFLNIERWLMVDEGKAYVG
jgi:hypothetical protein